MTDPYRELAADIIGLAVEQAKGNGINAQKARAWLMSPESDWLMMPLDVDVTIRTWVMGGCHSGDHLRKTRFDKKSDRDYRADYKRRLAKREGQMSP